MRVAVVLHTAHTSTSLFFGLRPVSPLRRLYSAAPSGAFCRVSSFSRGACCSAAGSSPSGCCACRAECVVGARTELTHGGVGGPVGGRHLEELLLVGVYGGEAGYVMRTKKGSRTNFLGAFFNIFIPFACGYRLRSLPDGGRGRRGAADSPCTRPLFLFFHPLAGHTRCAKVPLNGLKQCVR